MAAESEPNPTTILTAIDQFTLYSPEVHALVKLWKQVLVVFHPDVTSIEVDPHILPSNTDEFDNTWSLNPQMTGLLFDAKNAGIHVVVMETARTHQMGSQVLPAKETLLRSASSLIIPWEYHLGSPSCISALLKAHGVPIQPDEDVMQYTQPEILFALDKDQQCLTLYKDYGVPQNDTFSSLVKGKSERIEVKYPLMAPLLRVRLHPTEAKIHPSLVSTDRGSDRIAFPKLTDQIGMKVPVLKEVAQLRGEIGQFFGRSLDR